MTETEKRGAIQTSIRNLAILTAVTFLLLVGAIGFFAKTNHDLARRGDQAHTAVCTLRTDVGERIAASEQFLREHPEGIAGIPVATLRSSIEAQKRTYASLASAHCER